LANLLYVDNSNVWIEGMHVAAAKNGHAPNVWAAVQQRICDYTWTIDLGDSSNLRAVTVRRLGKPHFLGRALRKTTRFGSPLKTMDSKS
jgi:hypothetical protein